jgi:hypothetical protein
MVGTSATFCHQDTLTSGLSLHHDQEGKMKDRPCTSPQFLLRVLIRSFLPSSGHLPFHSAICEQWKPDLRDVCGTCSSSLLPRQCQLRGGFPYPVPCGEVGWRGGAILPRQKRTKHSIPTVLIRPIKNLIRTRRRGLRSPSPDAEQPSYPILTKGREMA